ncbi:MAG: hypothetical protein QXV69_00690 [Sulfolobaceae archaeon]
MGSIYSDTINNNDDIILNIENSKSKTSKHAIRTLLFRVIDSKNCSFEQVEKFNIVSRLKPTYSIGESINITLDKNNLYIYLRFIKNIKNKVYGQIIVIDQGKIVLQLKYRKLKIKRISGDARYYEECVKNVLYSLKIPIKRVNLK